MGDPPVVRHTLSQKDTEETQNNNCVSSGIRTWGTSVQTTWHRPNLSRVRYLNVSTGLWVFLSASHCRFI